VIGLDEKAELGAGHGFIECDPGRHSSPRVP
jgi:hypothetical protein